MGLTVGELNAVYKAKDEMSGVVDRLVEKNQKLTSTLAEVKAGSAATGAQARQLAADVTAAGSAADSEAAKFAKFEAALASGQYRLSGMADESKKAASAAGEHSAAMSVMAGFVGGFAATAGAAFVRVAVDSVTSTIRWADSLVRLSEESDMSLGALQRLQGIAVETRQPVERLTGWIEQLRHKIATDDGGLIRAADTLGISLVALRQKTGDQAFDEMITKLGEVKDQFTFNRTAAELFGESSVGALRGIASHWQEVKDKADSATVVLTDRQVKALADVGKRWDELTQKAKGYFAEMLSHVPHADPDGTTDANGIKKVIGPDGKVHRIVRTPEEQVADMIAGLKPPSLSTNAPAAPGMDLTGPGSDARMAAILAKQRELTAEHEKQVALEKEKTSWEKLELELSNLHAKEVKEVTAELAKQAAEAARVGGMNDAVLKNFNARVSNNAARGLDANGMPQTDPNDPLFKAQDKLRALDRNTPTGADNSALKQQIMDEFLKDIQEGTTVVVGMTAAERAAQASTDKMSDAHRNAADAANGAAGAFAAFTGVIPAGTQAFTADSNPTNNAGAFLDRQTQRQQGGGINTNTTVGLGDATRGVIASGIPHFAGGGLSDSSPHLAILGDGGEREYVIPESKMAKGGGSDGGAPTIHVHQGAIQVVNPVMTDPKSMLLLRQAVGAALIDGAKQTRRF